MSAISKNARPRLDPFSKAFAKAVESAENNEKWQAFKNSKFAQKSSSIAKGFGNFMKTRFVHLGQDISTAYYAVREQHAYRKEQKKVDKATDYLNSLGITTDETNRMVSRLDLNELARSQTKTTFNPYSKLSSKEEANFNTQFEKNKEAVLVELQNFKKAYQYYYNSSKENISNFESLNSLERENTVLHVMANQQMMSEAQHGLNLNKVKAVAKLSTIDGEKLNKFTDALEKSGNEDMVPWARLNARFSSVYAHDVAELDEQKWTEYSEMGVAPDMPKTDSVEKPETEDATAYEKTLEERTKEFFAKHDALKKERDEYFNNMNAEYEAKIQALKAEYEQKTQAGLAEYDAKDNALGKEYPDVLENEEKKMAALEAEKAKKVEPVKETAKTEKKAEPVKATTKKTSTKQTGKKAEAKVEKLDTPADKKARVKAAIPAEEKKAIEAKTLKEADAKPVKDMSPVAKAAVRRKAIANANKAKIEAAQSAPVQAIEAKATTAEAAPVEAQTDAKPKKGKNIIKSITTALNSETAQNLGKSAANLAAAGANLLASGINAKTASQMSNGYGEFKDMGYVDVVDNSRVIAAENMSGTVLPATTAEPLALPG